MIHVVCVRTGEKYSREYVAILHDSVRRNLFEDHQFWCLTDDPEQIHPEIGVIPADDSLDGWWQKVALFRPNMPWNVGDRVVYFDLDVAIVGRLEEVAETKGIIRDWNLPGFNSSVMVWDAGEHSEIWSRYNPTIPLEYPGDQDWITALAYVTEQTEGPQAPPTWDILPRDWCLSYRAHATEFPPAGSKVIVFHGEPKPLDCGGWVKDVWKLGGLTEFTQGTGMNVSYEAALENVRLNSARDVPWFIGEGPHKDTLVIVGGAPSLKESVDAINAHRQRGARILALNNAGAFLNSHGITPDALMVCDARPENVVFVRADAKRYILASQCDPSLFEEAKDKDVHLVHLWVCDEMRDVLLPYEETQPICLIGGGSTVGLRAIFLGIVSGYQKIHVYGMDSSFSDSKHHAYEQTLNDTDKAMEVFVPALDRHYVVAPWMARQASEFRDIAWPACKENKIKLKVHGKGLIPDMARHLEKQ